MSGPPEGTPSVTRRIPRPADAARTHRIDEHLFTLQVPLCYASVASVNAYLIRLADGWLLFDCGSCLPPGWPALAHALRGAGVAPSEITLLVVSHSHADHRGLASEVIARTGCRFAMGPGPHPVIDLLRDPNVALAQRLRRGRREGVPAGLLHPIVAELPAADEHYPHAEPDLVLGERQRLSSACGDWEVLALPGHSADQVGLWNPRHRWLLSADLALPGADSFLEYGTRRDPYADQLASLDRTIELAPALMLGGHGRPATDPSTTLRQCREAMRARLARVLDALDELPRSAWELARAMMSEQAEIDQWQRSLIGTRAVLEHLRLEGSAECVEGEEGVLGWVAN